MTRHTDYRNLPMAAELDELASWALQYIQDHPIPDFFLGPASDHQLERWYVVPRNPHMGVYLHRFWRSDDDTALHDHPYDNSTLILVGEYWEHIGDKHGVPSGVHHRVPGVLYRRKATTPHCVELRSAEPVITLFQVGPRYNDWGFYPPGGKVDWETFQKQRDGHV